MEGPLAWGEVMAAAITGTTRRRWRGFARSMGSTGMRRRCIKNHVGCLKRPQRRNKVGISGKSPLEILYWAMMEVESNDPVQRARWYRYASYDWVSSNLIWDGVRVVTTATRSPPHCPVMPVVTDDDVRVVPRQNVARVISQLPRRSPRFPRRSVRIQALAQRAADE
ncbi:hypothetical protein VPH35_100592 [Triticum aestivum]